MSEPWRRLQFVLGMGQMFGAVVAFVLLLYTGVSAATILATVLATATAVLSRALFHRRSSGHARPPDGSPSAQVAPDR